MALPAWGNLEKSQVDSETIEEAIARLIQAHEDDPNAHIEAGESLQSHKAAEVIDHIVASIIADKIKDGELPLRKTSIVQHQLYSIFESLDGWSGKGVGVTANIWGLLMQTGGIINTKKDLIGEPAGDGEALDFTKDPFFQTSFRVSSGADILVYVVAGPCVLDGTDGNFGFKILNGTLYASHSKTDGNEQQETTTEIAGITTTDWHVYRAVFDSTAGEIKFYVDGVLKATHTTDLPDINDPTIMTYYIKNTAAVNKVLYAKYLLWSREV